MAITEQLETPRWAQPGKDPRLTTEGVALIKERIRDIEQRRIPELRPRLVEDQWVSAESPLGTALLGKSPGDTVMVHAPRGAWECTIVSTDASLLAPNRQRD